MISLAWRVLGCDRTEAAMLVPSSRKTTGTARSKAANLFGMETLRLPFGEHIRAGSTLLKRLSARRMALSKN